MNKVDALRLTPWDNINVLRFQESVGLRLYNSQEWHDVSEGVWCQPSRLLDAVRGLMVAAK